MLNPAHYIDYQDCKYLGRGEMLCSGLTNYQVQTDAPALPRSAASRSSTWRTDRVDRTRCRSSCGPTSGLPMTQNPVWIETTADGLRAYFMPEDGKSTLYVYDADVK